MTHQKWCIVQHNQEAKYILMKIKVKYIGKDMAEIRNGEIYDADEVKDDSRYYGVTDRSGESYAYPKTLFEVIEG